MRRVSWLALALAAPLVSSHAQTRRWNDRADAPASEDAPTVTLTVDGARVFTYNTPVRIRFKVSDNAYAVVARVASDGRLTILFPQSRTDRSYVRANTEQIVRGRRTGAFASFYTVEPPGTGFVFAIASYAPIDLSAFKNSDFERMGIASPFQLASRGLSLRPESMIERFASWVLFDNQTPFDYDVDYYSVEVPQFASKASMCLGFSDLLYGEDLYSSMASYAPNPIYSNCRNYYNTYMNCLPFAIYGYSSFCSSFVGSRIAQNGPGTTPGPITPGTPADTSSINRGVLRGGLWQPDTVGRVADHDPRIKDTQADQRARAAGTRAASEADWDHVYSIPRHSLEGMKRTSNGPDKTPQERRAERFTQENEINNGRPTVDPGAQRRAEASRRANDPGNGPSEQPRRMGETGGASPRSGDAPARETPRTYNPPPREARPPREAPPPRETPRQQAPPPPRQAGGSESARSAPPPKTEPASQTKGTSGSTENPKKPPM